MSANTLASSSYAASTHVGTPNAETIHRSAWLGPAWSLGSVVARHAVSLVSTATAARFLLPADYGLVGLITSLIAFPLALADLGLTWPTVQKRELTWGQVNSLFRMNIATGLGLWGLTALMAPAVAGWFGLSELTPLAIAFGAVFALNGLAVQPMAILSRRMEFRATFWTESAGVAAGAMILVALAVWGFGPWALAGQALVGSIVRTTLAFAWSGFRPGKAATTSESASLFGFGACVATYTLINAVGRNLDNILIGRTWGLDALGFYTRAYFLMTVPVLLSAGALGAAEVSALSSLAHDRNRMGARYRQAMRLSALAGMPIAGVLFVAAPEVVRVLYGTGWEPTALLFRWLLIASFTQTVIVPSGWLYLVAGKGRALLVFGTAATLVQVAAFIAGNRYGPEGVAAGYALANLGLALPGLLASHRAASLPLRPTLEAITPVVLASLCATSVGMSLGLIQGPRLLVFTLKIAMFSLVFGMGAAGQISLLHKLVKERP